MVSFISSWAQQIIFAVIIGTILQMLLPEGKNKKYVKIVIGVYVLFAVISPVIGKNIDLNFNDLNITIENTVSNIATANDENINNLFVTNLKQDIKLKLNNKNYDFKSIQIETNENYELEKITITGIYELKEKTENEEKDKVNTVEINEISIGAKENDIKEQVVKGISVSKEKDLKEYLSETYNVKESNIEID